MPSGAPSVCDAPGCQRVAVAGRFCAGHAPRAGSAPQAKRPSAARRGYDRRWQRESRAWLAALPGIDRCCWECRRRGRWGPAEHVDHVVPHRGDETLFWDPRNWQPLCASCHGRKTRREGRRNEG